MNKTRYLSLLLIGFLALLVLPSSTRNKTAQVKAATSFVFTAEGDIGANSNSAAMLTGLATSGTAFNLAVGDLSYNNITPESAWCKYVTDRVGTTMPFELLAGNHESDGLNGLIDTFAACLPDRLGNISGVYAKEYYFDYPATSPLARIIMTSPGLNFTNGGSYSYAKGTAHYNWLSSTIDAARAANIPWVIVADHKNCLTSATKPCEISADFMNLLVSKKVDLVLQGHDHTYQRSKQLTLNSSTCTALVAGSYNSACVINDGASNTFTKGAGTIFVINGAGGASLYSINTADTEAPYFTKLMGSNVNPTWGYSKFNVSDSQISVDFVRTSGGTFTDSFTLGSTVVLPPPDTTAPTVSITAPAAGAGVSGPVTVNATATDDVGVTKVEFYVDGILANTDSASPYSFSWDSTAVANGSHTLSAKAYDAAGNIGSSPNVSITTSNCPTVPADLGTATQSVSVGADGTYRIWSRIMGGGDASNSYFLQIDGNCAVNVGDLAGMAANSWVWVDYQGGNSSTKINAALTAGTHTLKFIGREAGTKLDNAILTLDTTCTPTGDGSNCQPDTTPPTVSITSPLNGATISGSVVVSTTASDDRGTVSKVELWVDNLLNTTDTTSPFNFSWGSTSVPNGSHCFLAKAYDPSGNVGSSSSVCVTVNNGDTTNPTVTLTSPANGATISGNVTVAANATDNIGVTKVEFYVDSTLENTDSASPYSFTLDSTTVADGTHSILAKAYDASGNSGSDTVSVTVKNADTTLPSTPTNLTATAPAYNQVKLAWTASTDNVGVTGYWIVRNGVTINSSTTNSYTDNSVNEKTGYSYQVMAFDAAGNNSSFSNTAIVTTPAAPDTSAPTAPTGLTATAVSSSQVNLVWTASTDNLGVAGYDIYRNNQKIITVTTTSFGDTGLAASTTYSYYVKAVDAAGNVSAASNTVSVQTQAGGQILSFSITDDAYIDKSHATSNYGLGTTLQVDNQPIQNYLMKFTVSGVGTQQILTAKLRIYCTNKSKTGGSFYRVTNNTWSEKTINWSNAPAADATKFTSIGNASAGKWYDVDLKPIITGDGTFSIRVASTASDAAWYSSKEGSNKPQLLITVQ